VVATFLAMLELIRLEQIKIDQEDNFGDIVITEGDGLTEFDPMKTDTLTEPAPVAE